MSKFSDKYRYEYDDDEMDFQSKKKKKNDKRSNRKANGYEDYYGSYDDYQKPARKRARHSN